MPGEIELFDQVENACVPMVLRLGRVEKNGLELPQLTRDLSHLRGAESTRGGKDAQAVAAIMLRGEHIDELELHRNDATTCATIERSSSEGELVQAPGVDYAEHRGALLVGGLQVHLDVEAPVVVT